MLFPVIPGVNACVILIGIKGNDFLLQGLGSRGLGNSFRKLMRQEIEGMMV
jgi:hypothetical protein